jgi:uncharacterized protein YndB with AHSA1/START domain
MPTAKRGHAQVDIAASPERVFRLITDITRMGEWSPECYRCAWLDGATGARVGARFRGYNKLGRFQWATTAVITAVEDGRLLAFTIVHDKTGRDETAWRYQLAPSPSGTTLTESFEFLWCPIASRIAELPVPRGSQVNRGLRETLRAIKAAAEAPGDQ